jgi:BirA family biotin operon repressor/biotin-[acetyl-CoA-carboxylase] ligase
MDDLSGPRILNGLAGTRFRNVEVHASIDSTQTTLVREGGRDGRVVVADHQTAGRGRAGRSWTDVPGAMLMFSALLRDVPAAQSPLVSFAAAFAVGHSIANLGESQTNLKWPNDVRIGHEKICGMLGELSPDGSYIVVGIGVNVGHGAGELPPELNATSMRLACSRVPRRDDLCIAILSEFDRLLREFTPEQWVAMYRNDCSTIGSRVRVELGDRVIEGMAEGVRDDGALIVEGNAVVAGDVVHVR